MKITECIGLQDRMIPGMDRSTSNNPSLMTVQPDGEWEDCHGL